MTKSGLIKPLKCLFLDPAAYCGGEASTYSLNGARDAPTITKSTSACGVNGTIRIEVKVIIGPRRRYSDDKLRTGTLNLDIGLQVLSRGCYVRILFFGVHSIASLKMTTQVFTILRAYSILYCLECLEEFLTLELR